MILHSYHMEMNTRLPRDRAMVYELNHNPHKYHFLLLLVLLSVKGCSIQDHNAPFPTLTEISVFLPLSIVR